MVNKVVPEQHAETHPSVKYFFKKVQPENREMPGLGFSYTNLTFSFYISTYLI